MISIKPYLSVLNNMKCIILSFLLLLNSLVFADLLPSDNVALPKNSQMKFLGEDSENGAYEFKGRVSLKGFLVAGWVINWNGDDVVNKGRARHILELRFIPEKNQLALLPSLKKDVYRNSDRTIILSNGAKERKALVKKYFNNIPNNFFKDEEGVLGREAVVTLDEYRTFVECDSRHFYAKLIAVEKIATNARLVGKEEGCGKGFAVDLYTVKSKDGYTNLRSAPDKNAKVLAKMPNDVTFEKIKTRGDWFYVEQTDKPKVKGYIHKSQVLRASECD